MQRVLVTLNRENEALVVAEKARTRAFLDMESGKHYYGQANIEIKSEGDIVSLVNRQKASVLYYSMAAGYLYSWLIVPTKGVVKFHEVCIEEDGEAGTNVVIQVWSLSQFYSVDFSKSRIGEKSAFSTNAQSRFASVVVGGVLGPPRLARHT